MVAVLQVSDAHKRFGDTVALCGAEFELRAGELLCLLGPNGAGKTTLIRAIAGRVRLDRGTASCLPRPGDSRPASLGVVPQEIALYPLLTARENLEVFGRLHGVPRLDLPTRVGWALDWTALAERASDRAATFSGGMRRRLNIACGVLHRPGVLLLDEPTVGVDPQSRARIWEMLAALQSEGISLLLTTHQLDEAQQYCERIVIVDHGRTIAAGTLGELIERTVGSLRKVTVRLGRALDAFPGAELSGDGRSVRHDLSDVAAELPPILAKLQAVGCPVEDIHIESPSLQAVFLHLTGRELRE